MVSLGTPGSIGQATRAGTDRTKKGKSMSNEGKEIRIRNIPPNWRKRIALAAKEAGLNENTFCLYAALERCDRDLAKKALLQEWGTALADARKGSK